MSEQPVRVEQAEWETWYQDEDVESMPWFLSELDHDFAQTLSGNLDLRDDAAILDLGTGPGTQAIELSRRGFRVTATDLSETAIGKAVERSARSGVLVEFIHDDILHTQLNGQRFNVILDRGCFHVLPPDNRGDYINNVTELLESGGYLLLKCFSHLQPGSDGPHRFRPEEIRDIFGQKFEVHEITDSVFFGNHRPPPKALYCVLRKR